LVAPHDLMTPSAVRRRRALLTYLYEIDIWCCDNFGGGGVSLGHKGLLDVKH
jgi:hypothetical protein